MFEKIKKFYDLGLWTVDMVHNAVDKGLITEDEYVIIVATRRNLTGEEKTEKAFLIERQ